MSTESSWTPLRSQTRRRRHRLHGADLGYQIVATSVLGLAVLGIVYPLYFIVIASISDPAAVNNGEVWLWPVGITGDGYQRLLSEAVVWRGIWNSLIYTFGATVVSVAMILAAGYALSRRDLPGRHLILVVFLVPFFLDGGLIPRYLVVQQLGMLNTPWAMILPGAVAVWNLIIARTWFASNIPGEVLEAAQIDGAGEFRTFVSVVLPLSKPLIGVMVLIHVVWNWNAYFDALIFLTDEDRFPLQLVMRNILIQSSMSSGDMVGDLSSFAEQQRVAGLVKYAMIVVSTVPLLLFTPFAQRYLSRGGVSGAIKG